MSLQALPVFKGHKSQYEFLFSVGRFRILWNDVGRNSPGGSRGDEHCPVLTSKPFVSWSRWLAFWNSSGNQLDLWAAVTKMDLHDAAIDLCEKAQVEIPWIRKW
jgi:hypothetical protein